MKNLSALIMLLTFLSIIACTKTIDLEAEKAAIIKVMEMTVEAEKNRDADAAVTFFTDDAIIQPADMPQIQGIQALHDLYIEFFKMPDMTFESQSTETVVASSGDTGYNIGWNLFIFEGPEGNIEVKGKYLAVMKKIEGEWKIAALSFSNDQPAK